MKGQGDGAGASNLRGHLAVMGTNLFFGINYSMVKLVSPSHIGPFAVNILRVGVSLVFFWLLWMFSNGETKIRKEDIPRLIVCALTGIAINQMMFIKGLTLTSTIHASLLMLVTPILITLFAAWVLKERLSLSKAAGLSLGIGGAMFLVLQKESGQHATNYLLGDIFIIINAISYSIFFILVKPLMLRYSPLQVVRWTFTIGFFMILPFAWSETLVIKWSAFEWQHIAAMTFVIIPGTFLAYVFNTYGIQRLGASTTGAYMYTQPVIAAIVASFVLGESFTLEKALAALFIFAGVFLVGRKRDNVSTADLKDFSGNRKKESSSPLH